MLASIVFFQSCLLYAYSFAYSQMPRACPPRFPNTTVCGAISVPLDHSNAVSRKINVAYAILPPQNPLKRSSKFPFVFLNGGAADSILQNPYDQLVAPGVADRMGRPILLMDYRGLGTEGTLDCSLQKAYVPDDVPPEVVRDCLKELGPRTVFYSTESSARDLENLRRILGFEKLILYGLSYGTRVAQTYSILFPSRVRSVILDSARPINQLDQYSLIEYRAYGRIIALKNANNRAFSKQKLRRDLSIVLRRLRKSSALREQAGVNTSGIFKSYRAAEKDLPGALSVAVEKNDYVQLRALVAKQIFVRPPIEARLASRGVRYSVACNDVVNLAPWGPSAKYLERRLALRFAISYNVPRKAYAPFTRQEALESDFKRCVGFPFPQKRPTALHSPPDVPVLTLYGTLDRSTPLELLEELHPTFKKTVAIIARTGHVTTSNLCALKLVIEFANRNKVTNASACA